MKSRRRGEPSASKTRRVSSTSLMTHCPHRAPATPSPQPTTPPAIGWGSWVGRGEGRARTPPRPARSGKGSPEARRGRIAGGHHWRTPSTSLLPSGEARDRGAVLLAVYVLPLFDEPQRQNAPRSRSVPRQQYRRFGRGVRYPATTISIGTDRTAATTPTPRVLPAGRRGCPERVAGRTARR